MKGTRLSQPVFHGRKTLDNKEKEKSTAFKSEYRNRDVLSYTTCQCSHEPFLFFASRVARISLKGYR
jgi:hypothetical protein